MPSVVKETKNNASTPTKKTPSSGSVKKSTAARTALPKARTSNKLDSAPIAAKGGSAIQRPLSKKTRTRKKKKRPFKYLSQLPIGYLWQTMFIPMLKKEILARESQILKAAREASRSSLSSNPGGKPIFAKFQKTDAEEFYDTKHVLSMISEISNLRSQRKEGLREEEGGLCPEEDGRGSGSNVILFAPPRIEEEAKQQLNLVMDQACKRFLSRSEKMCALTDKVTLGTDELACQVYATNGFKAGDEILAEACAIRDVVLKYYASRPKVSRPNAFKKKAPSADGIPCGSCQPVESVTTYQPEMDLESI